MHALLAKHVPHKVRGMLAAKLLVVLAGCTMFRPGVVCDSFLLRAPNSDAASN
jgi:hypothetical protein